MLNPVRHTHPDGYRWALGRGPLRTPRPRPSTVPQHFVCPITLEVMRDPWQGHSPPPPEPAWQSGTGVPKPCGAVLGRNAPAPQPLKFF